MLSSLNNSPNKNKANQLNSSVSEKSKDISYLDLDSVQSTNIKNTSDSRTDKRRDRDKAKAQEKNKRNIINKAPVLDTRPGNEISVVEKHSLKTSIPAVVLSPTPCNRITKKRNQKQETIVNCSNIITAAPVSGTKSISSTICSTADVTTVDSNCQNQVRNNHCKQKETLVNGINNNSITDYSDLCALLGQNATLKGKKNSTDKPSL